MNYSSAQTSSLANAIPVAMPLPSAKESLALAVASTRSTPKKMNYFVMQIGRFVLFTACVFMLVAAIHPDVRGSMRGTFLKDYRNIVSTVHGDLIGGGGELIVAKIKTRDSLFLEVYEPKADGSRRLVERIELPDKKDGYFAFNGMATNLAIDDIDGDGRNEILVPTFDQNLVGHLNIYRYDNVAGVFNRSMR